MLQLSYYPPFLTLGRVGYSTIRSLIDSTMPCNNNFCMPIWALQWNFPQVLSPELHFGPYASRIFYTSHATFFPAGESTSLCIYRISPRSIVYTNRMPSTVVQCSRAMSSHHFPGLAVYSMKIDGADNSDICWWQFPEERRYWPQVWSWFVYIHVLHYGEKLPRYIWYQQ